MAKKVISSSTTTIINRAINIEVLRTSFKDKPPASYKTVKELSVLTGMHHNTLYRLLDRACRDNQIDWRVYKGVKYFKIIGEVDDTKTGT